MTTVQAAAAAAVEAVARTSYGRLVAYLASVTGDLAAAEDALSEALVAALSTWPEKGIPERPDAWLVTEARRTLIDAARRRTVARAALPALEVVMQEHAERAATGPIPDERLRLMFVCAHPAIAAPMRSPLMLQTVLGLDAARIAQAFVTAPMTMGQRLVRAKAKIKEAGIPFRVPEREELAPRLGAVLDAVYAAYGTGWDDVDELDGLDAARRDLVPEAIRLARLLVELLPGEPEAHGLLALILHTHARRDARRADVGSYVPLAEQDVARWSRVLVEEAESHLARALAGRRVGPYQLQAAIQSVHNRRSATGRAEWAAITQLYDGLVRLAPSIGAAVARAAAYRQAHGPGVALPMLDELAAVDGGAAVQRYQPYWVVRALCEREIGHHEAADGAAERAAALTSSPQVLAHLRRTLQR